MLPPRGANVVMTKDLALYLLKIYLSHLGERIQFLDWLTRNRGRYEALILCCCYIDGLGRYVYATEDLESHCGFVRVLREYGDDPILPLVHPRHMMLILNRRARHDKTFASIRQAIDPLLQGCVLVSEDDFLASARPLLSND